MLEIADLSKRFGGIQALEGVSLAVPEGSICGIIGPNGAGKTTLFNLITGIYSPSRGSVSFGGRTLTGLPPYAIARTGLARTFQNIHLFKGLSVLNNVKTACHMQAKYGILESLLRLPRVRVEERMLEEQAFRLLELVGLEANAHAPAEDLPYGHQRRLEIAKALALKPRLLLLDEPAAGMNSEESLALLELIKRVHQEYRLTVLLIEHHMEVVMRLCSQIVVLNFGQKLAEGTPEEVQSNPKVIEAYLGEEGAAC